MTQGGSEQIRVTNTQQFINGQIIFGFSVTNSLDMTVTSSVPVLRIGSGSAGDSSACILAKTKAGAPTTSDVPASTWALIRDTSGATTKIYYNNAGTLMSVALT